jgi:hypothetical protein
MIEEPAAQEGESEEQASEDANGQGSERSAEKSMVSGRLLRGSDLLTAREASQSLAQGPGRTVVWAGERGSGKTTLTAELYERHRRGKAATKFAGSRTLLALEERMHPARAASERVQPHTPRTESDPEGREFLHLAVSGPTMHLVFADLPGELFRQFRDNEISPADFPLLARADKLAVLVDGQLIADPARRAAAYTFAGQLVDRLVATDLPDSRTQVALVLTKQDLLEEAGQAALEYWESREQTLLDKLRARDPGARAFRTAARGCCQEGDDGMELLMAWLLEPPREANEPLLEPMQEPSARLQRLRQPRTLR